MPHLGRQFRLVLARVEYGHVMPQLYKLTHNIWAKEAGSA
jgi:hypothetical protein